MKQALYPFLAVLAGLAFAVATGSVHLATLNFWLTAAVALGIVGVFHFLTLSALRQDGMTTNLFLFRTVVVVILVQLAFACIYFFAATGTSYLSKGGQPVTDFVDALYFSGVTLMTVGYGDIVPVGDFRFTAVAEVYGGTLFIFAFFSWGLWVMSDRRRGKQ